MSKTGPLDNDDLDLKGQTSNKTGKHSARAKPSSAGPGSHEQHKAAVPGAFGGSGTDEAKDSNDTPLGQWVPSDKAHLKDK